MIKVYLTNEDEEVVCRIVEFFTHIGYCLRLRGEEGYVSRVEFERSGEYIKQ